MAHASSHSPASMTGFARMQGQWRELTWQWELKAVNGKAFDVRFRLPGGLDHLEPDLRGIAAAAIKRGNVQVGLVLQGATSRETVVVNDELLAQITAAAKALRKNLRGPPIQAESLLSLKGVLDITVATISDGDMLVRDKALLGSFNDAVHALNKARREEGTRLGAVLMMQISRIAELVDAAAANPSRQVDVVRQRLREQVGRLLETGASFDEQRLHQEAVLLATKADIQEEIDRLRVHVASARELLQSSEAIGRKFDFLAQEFNREANTLCSKSSDAELTKTGLELKLIIDQMREQVQNIE